MKKLLLGLTLLASMSALADSAAYIMKIEKAIILNDASVIALHDMSLEKAQKKSLALLEKYEATDKKDVFALSAIIREAQDIWVLLGKEEAGVKEAVYAIIEMANDHHREAVREHMSY